MSGKISEEPFTVQQVADHLGLHVRTVRNHIRSGRLAAARIGRQYRIARSDLEAFAGASAPGAPRPRPSRPHVEVSAAVQVEPISREGADRLSILTTAGAQNRGAAANPLRVNAGYDPERSRLTLMILGDAAEAADLLHTLAAVAEAENSLTPPTDPEEDRRD